MVQDAKLELINKLLLEKYEPIAIVGIGLRFPGGVNTLDAFAEMLAQGKEGVTSIPESRWDNKKYFDEVQGSAGKIATHGGGYIDDHDQFDPVFFSISPKEASHIDPQQRLMLELSIEALQQANIDPEILRGESAGVFIGVSTVDYAKETTELREDSLVNHMGTGTANSAISGRISYFLGLRGPCMSIDTACSSSLVALHLAMNSLRNQESSIVLCGGVNVVHHPYSMIIFSQANMLSQDGRCKTFDSSADGYGRSEGAGMLVLKRLSDAIKDENNILAILRGSSVSQDGESGGLTVPSGVAQEMVMNKALENSLLQAADVNYVEAHGTGTPLGDPIEIQAINKVFDKAYDKNHPFYVASVKTNLGHMEAAAGMGGLIKVVLQLQNKCIYPHLHMKNPSPHIPWEELAMTIPQAMLPWHADKKRALVNSFGFAGTIASVVMEEAPVNDISREDAEIEVNNIFTLSAKNIHSLKLSLDQYIEAVEKLQENKLTDFCVTTNTGRTHFPFRSAALVSDKNSLLTFLNKQKESIQDIFSTQPKPVAMLFTGQGSQYIGMGKTLYARYKVVKEIINHCDELFKPLLGVSIKDLMFGLTSFDINKTMYTQPALFCIEYALANLWISFGIKPDILIGHSVGEIVAATVAELFSLENAILLVATRARLMQSVARNGGMVAIQAGFEVVKHYIESNKEISLAAVNSPSQCVISGDKEILQSICSELKQAGINYKELVVSHAFHSAHMEEVFDEFRKSISQIHFKHPKISFISNITGKVNASEVMTPEYWVTHIRQPVYFADGMNAIANRGEHVFLEVGPSPHLTALGKQGITDSKHLWLFTMKEKINELKSLHDAVLGLYQSGAKINWHAVHDGRNKNIGHIDLPLYAFNRKRYWLPDTRKSNDTNVYHPLLGKKQLSNGKIIEFHAEISANTPAYLADHIVTGKVVFPGAGYMEIVLAMQDAVFGKVDYLIEDFHIHEPLFLNHENKAALLTRLTEIDKNNYTFEIISDNKYKHVTGKLVKSDAHGLMHLFADFPEEVIENSLSGEEVYDNLKSKGLQYGPLFKKLYQVEMTGKMTAKGKIADYEAASLEFINPAILDAVLHTIGPLMASIDAENTYLPTGFKKFLFIRKPKKHVQCKVILGEIGTAHLMMQDENGPVFIAENLIMTKISGISSNRLDEKLFHQTRWMPEPLESREFQATSFLSIRQPETSENIQVTQFITHASSMNAVDAHLHLNPACQNIVYFWQNETRDLSADAVMINSEYNYKFILDLISLLENKYLSRNIKLIFVTCGAQILANDNHNDLSALNISQASLWGFAAVLNNEHPKYQCRIIDFDPAENLILSNYKNMINEISIDQPDEFQIAYRKGIRFVRRLAAINIQKKENDNFKLDIAEYGSFSNIKPKPIQLDSPSGDQILVKVQAVGLNFKDVLNALGMLKQHAEANNLEYLPLPLGFECSGTVIEAGSEADFSPADEVIISHLGCMQKYLTVSSKAAVRKPKNISFDQAAGLATAYITSFYALHHLANIKKGEKILIHAAAGGVGQAAIQLAKKIGAEIYATASKPKWDFLKNQGIRHIMNSRDLEFGSTRGMDIVLNSLNKNYIPVSLGTLAENGRFIEMGKIDIWNEAMVKSFRGDIKYYNFDLSEMPANELQAINKNILEEIVANIEKNELSALPVTVYTLDKLQESFSVLSRGNNLGKIVISFAEENVPVNLRPVTVQSDKTYLITGGYGALGIKTAKWLVKKGARHIALLGRNIPPALKIADIKTEINCHQLSLTCHQADIANEEQIHAVFEHIAKEPYRLGGIVHAAGVLEDAPINTQNWSTISKVFAAKVAGTWLLHQEAARIGNLDFFISYSSVASIAGSIGQANYAAANAFMDSLMNWRAIAGQHGLAINWGPWSSVGMAANLHKVSIQSIEEKGMKFLNPTVALNAMTTVTSLAFAQVIIGEFNWSAYHDSLPLDNKFYINVASKKKINEVNVNLDMLLSLIPKERLLRIKQIIRNKLARILHFDDENEISLEARFSDLGLDSLVAVEFKIVLEKSFKLSMRSSIIFDYPSIPGMSQFIMEELFTDNKSKSSRFSKIMNKLKI